jgi:hypothetical protein
LQAGGILRISRTVQWLREASGLKAHHSRRILEEVVLTGIYLAVFARWLWAEQAPAAETREFLIRQLGRAQSLGCWP